MLAVRCPIVPGSAALGLLLLTACAYVDPDPNWPQREAHVAAVESFEVGARGLAGVDGPRAPDLIARGDRIQYGIEFEKQGVHRHWLVHVEVLDPEFEPRVTRYGTTRAQLELAVRVTDEEGRELGRDRVTVSREDLVFGLFSACRAHDDSVASPPEDVVEAATPLDVPVPFGRASIEMRASLALVNMLQVVRESGPLFDILWTVIDKPSIFSVVRHLGVRVSIQGRFEHAVRRAPIALGEQELPIYELPIELRLNGRPALRTKLWVAEPNSPLNLSAGIVAIDAFQPSDPTARVSIRVLAARRAVIW